MKIHLVRPSVGQSAGFPDSAHGTGPGNPLAVMADHHWELVPDLEPPWITVVGCLAAAVLLGLALIIG